MTAYAVQYRYTDDAAARDEHRPAHRAFLGSLADDGTLLASGPLGPDADGADGALLVLREDDRQAVLELLREDPFQQQGLVEQVTVREWTIVLGAWAGDA